MREIKFRAWDIARKKMVYRGLHDMNWYYTPCNDEKGCHLAYETTQRDRHDLNVMQHTGLKDKNGKEIWEGDILSIYPGEPEINKVLQVKWCSDYCKFGWNIRGAMFCKGNENLFVIIGNVYENPELCNKDLSV